MIILTIYFIIYKGVQIKIHSVGICGTDISFWKNGAVGKYKLSEPVVLGHEPSGVVTKVGPGVTSITEGQSRILKTLSTLHLGFTVVSLISSSSGYKA